MTLVGFLVDGLTKTGVERGEEGGRSVGRDLGVSVPYLYRTFISSSQSTPTRSYREWKAVSWCFTLTRASRVRFYWRQ